VKLTLGEVQVGIGNLKAVFTPPKGVAQGDAMARVYFEALADLSSEDFQVAITQAIRTESKFWPRPGKLRELANEHRKSFGLTASAPPLTPYQEYLEHPSDWHKVPCPVCGALLEWREGRRGHVYHDVLKHRDAQEPYVGEAA
jgi:hypothetical protein